jgi:hypothetical protein
VAVGRKKIAERVEGESKRVHLAVRELFHPRTVQPHAKGVAGLHGDHAAIGAFDL